MLNQIRYNCKNCVEVSPPELTSDEEWCEAKWAMKQLAVLKPLLAQNRHTNSPSAPSWSTDENSTPVVLRFPLAKIFSYLVPVPYFGTGTGITYGGAVRRQSFFSGARAEV